MKIIINLLALCFLILFIANISVAEENKKIFELSILPSYAIPVGATDQDIEAGYMQQVRIGFNSSNTSLWGMNLFTANLSIKQKSLRGNPSLPSLQMPSFDGDINIMHLGLYYQFSVITNIARTYFLGGCAYYKNEIEIKALVYENTENVLLKNNDSDFGYFIGSGISGNMGNNFCLGVEAVFHHQFEAGDDIQYVVPAFKISYLF